MSGVFFFLHADKVIACVHMVHLTNDARGEIGEQIKPGPADIVDRDVAAKRRIDLIPL